ncbi:hypothetical protein AVEN_67910-1 [Araneus ventricosus]|uniref:Transposable element Tc3 transposase n=1 Tax=Araneus ventricosus TaxID=182803 RepID=A0A4Y2ST69_ARAVE|nr:hypothetical protein AVEN_67910-1 [Araneus ventricosus]
MTHVFSECLIDRTFIPGRWKIRDMLSKFVINYAGRFMFGAKFLMTGSLERQVFYDGTLTEQRYLELLQDIITDFVENLPLHQLRNVWFQHGGAPLHKISNVKQYLMETFQNQVIGYGGFVEWPPRSPDLTPLDFFFWGHMKGQVYATPPPTSQDLRRHITDACASVTLAMLHYVQREIQYRVQMCIVANGEHFEQYK